MARLLPAQSDLRRIPPILVDGIRKFAVVFADPRTRRRAAKEGILGAVGLLVVFVVAVALFGGAQQGAPSVVMRLSDGPPSIQEHAGEGGITGAIAEHDEPSADLDQGTKHPLIEETPIGPLPRIAEDGRTPARTFARPPPSIDGRPIVSLVVTGMGRKSESTAEAITELPPEVSLVFDPYAPHLDHWATEAHRHGHEYFIEVPVEPFDFPANDPGPLALTVSARSQENVTRLHITLSRMSGYAGLALSGRSRLATDKPSVTELMTEAKSRGLLVFDTAGSPVSKIARVGRTLEAEWGVTDRRLDRRPTQDGLALQLLEMERLALQQGYAIGTADAYPLVIDQVARWVRTLPAKGLVLAPVSVHMLKKDPAGLTAAHKAGADDRRAPSGKPHAKKESHEKHAEPDHH